jgi:TfoX/Sxy family transcriptional regulator of competence genes
MAEPQELFDNIASDMLAKGDTKRAKMFGSPCLSVNGKVFASFHKDDMTFKLGQAAREQALQLAGARHFDPGMGRPMKEWVSVPTEQSDHWRELADQAYSYIADRTSR